MEHIIIKNASIVNEGKIIEGDLLISKDRIEKIGGDINIKARAEEMDGTGLHVLTGVIGDQVHFREPGLTHKANLYTEAKAAVAGGTTSYMEMPNTSPAAITVDLLEQKYSRAAECSLANYSFFMGTSNDNLEEILKVNKKKHEVCGVKIFMGSSTGNLLVNNTLQLEKVFGGSELLIATHCEEETLFTENLKQIKATGKKLTAADHPIIRNDEVS